MLARLKVIRSIVFAATWFAASAAKNSLSLLRLPPHRFERQKQRLGYARRYAQPAHVIGKSDAIMKERACHPSGGSKLTYSSM
jgi:hypothetical protein